MNDTTDFSSTEHRPEVIAQLRRLGTAVDELWQSTEQLAGHLSPVLRPATTAADPRPSAPDDPEVSPHAVELAGVARSIEELNQTIVLIIRRVDL
jgi:hypothetical protein